MEHNTLECGDIFFLEIPEILAAIDSLPRELSAELLAKIRNRRKGYQTEIKLKAGEKIDSTPNEEADYY